MDKNMGATIETKLNEKVDAIEVDENIYAK